MENYSYMATTTFTNARVSERAEILAWFVNENNLFFRPKDSFMDSVISKKRLAQRLGLYVKRVNIT